MSEPGKIIYGPYENAWDGEASANVVNEEGDINWRAAFTADPGVRRCECGLYLWDEARVLECPDCEAWGWSKHDNRKPKVMSPFMHPEYGACLSLMSITGKADTFHFVQPDFPAEPLVMKESEMPTILLEKPDPTPRFCYGEKVLVLPSVEKKAKQPEPAQ